MITRNILRGAMEQESRLAEHFFSKGEVARALPHFRRALLIDPESHKSLLRAGQCLDRLGQWNEAYESFRGILEGDGMSADVGAPDTRPAAAGAIGRCEENLQREILQAFTNVCHKVGRETEVIEWLNRYTAMIEQTPALFYNLGLAYYKCQRFSDAQDCFNRLKAAHPRNSAGYIGTAILHCHLGRMDDAVRELQVARSAAPQDVQVIENLAVVQMKMGNHLGAVSTLRSAISAGGVSQNAKLFHLLGMAHLRIGELARAEVHLRRSLEIERSAEALREMGWLRVAKGDYLESIELLKEALTINPNDIWAKVDLAIAYFKQGVTVDAQVLFNEARAAAPTPEVTKLLDDLARVMSAGSASPTPQVPASLTPAGSASPTPQVPASLTPAGSASPTPQVPASLTPADHRP